VVCHPHPQYGGEMHNPVVEATAHALVDAGWTTLRFNFGGVGRSGGSYSGGPEEVRDVATALHAVAEAVPPGTPRLVAGYSFGAWAGAMAARNVDELQRIVAVAPPLAFFDWSFAETLRAPFIVIVGDRDQYCPRSRLDDLMASCGGRASVTTIPGGDHFLAGREDDVAAAVRAAL
jgi:alpha/beta superfamily hydrolase